MRIALLSDIHGNLLALESIHTDIGRRGADIVAVLGDNLSGPLLPLETAQYLRDTGWLVLAGNHDRQVLNYQPGLGEEIDAYAASQLTSREKDWLKSLEPNCQYSSELLLCHGTPNSDCTYLLETVRHGRMQIADTETIAKRTQGCESAVIACGHSHTPRVVRTQRGQLIVNPGSVGLQAYRDDDEEPHLMEMGSIDARYAIIERINNRWVAELHSVPYDNQCAAALARSRGSHNWETALLTGYAPERATSLTR